MRTAILILALITGPAFGQVSLRSDGRPLVQTPRERIISECFRDALWDNTNNAWLRRCMEAAK